ncbi:MAG: hypothetical protein HZC48_00630 [Nitrospirae bacterium]|nr:hypothetical protein [Nitrospirota bacterium]
MPRKNKVSPNKHRPRGSHVDRVIDNCHDIVGRFYCQDIVNSHRKWHRDYDS